MTTTHKTLVDYFRRYDGVILAEEHGHPANPVVYKAIFAAANKAGVRQTAIEQQPKSEPYYTETYGTIIELMDAGMTREDALRYIRPLDIADAHIVEAYSYRMDVLCVDVGNRNVDDAIYAVTTDIEAEVTEKCGERTSRTAFQPSPELAENILSNRDVYIGELGYMPDLEHIWYIRNRFLRNYDRNIKELLERRVRTDPQIADEIIEQTKGKKFVGVFGRMHAAGMCYSSHINVTRSLRAKGLNMGLVAVGGDLPDDYMAPDFVLLETSDEKPAAQIRRPMLEVYNPF